MEPFAPGGYVVLNEVFDSIQGEGPSAGEKRVFVRLAGCNLSCAYCDTPYTWDYARFDRRAETFRSTLSALRARISGSPGVVFTGGEPLLQQRKLGELLALLPRELIVEVETNGTLVPSPALAERVDQWNVSPKLSGAQQRSAEAIVPEALQALQATGRMWLKFVVDDESEVAEAQGLCAELKIDAERVFLQPQAITREQLLTKSKHVVRWCQEGGLRFSPRLHVAAWGTRRGY